MCYQDTRELDGFTIEPTADGYAVTVTRCGRPYAWLHTFSTRDYARQVCASVAPWAIAWAELDGGKLVGLRDKGIGGQE